MAVLVYDGDCGFCQWSLRWGLRLGITCDHVAGQRADLPALGLTPADVEAAAWYVDGDRWRRRRTRGWPPTGTDCPGRARPAGCHPSTYARTDASARTNSPLGGLAGV